MENFYIGLTDYDWYKYHKEMNTNEVNFWRPGTQSFKALDENGLFLFKLKKKYGSLIVGGGRFKKYINIPIAQAWDLFREKNGSPTKMEFIEKITSIRKRINLDANNSLIGCVILTDTFYLDENNGISGPNDWSDCIVTGSKYDANSPEGKRIIEELYQRI